MVDLGSNPRQGTRRLRERTMTTDDKTKTINDIPEEQRADVQTLIDSSVNAVKEASQTEFDTFKQTQNAKFDTLKTAHDLLEDTLAGTEEGKSTPKLPGELNNRQQEIIDRRAREARDAEQAEIVRSKDEIISSQNAILMRQLTAEAAGLNIPQALIDGAKTLADLNKEIERSKLYGAIPAAPKKDDKPGPSPMAIMSGDGPAGDNISANDAATSLIGDTFK